MTEATPGRPAGVTQCHPLAEPLDEEAAFQFMYDLARGRITASGVAERLQKFGA